MFVFKQASHNTCFVQLFSSFFCPSSQNPAWQLWRWVPPSPFTYTVVLGELEATCNFHPLSSGQLLNPRLYNYSGFRMQHVPSHFRSAVSLDSVWFISICIISSALYISFRHQRFSLVTVLCHLSFTCLLSEFDLIPLVYFKRLISYPHSALFHCDFQAFVFSIWIFLIVIFILYLEINPPSFMILKKVINLTSSV